MRIVIANPPGFGGPDYDHHLCTALAARGEDVELVTTRFRFGQMPDAEGYRRSLVSPARPACSAARACACR